MDTNLHSKVNDSQILKHIQTLQKKIQIVKEKYHKITFTNHEIT
jgi:hypothetical protein